MPDRFVCPRCDGDSAHRGYGPPEDPWENPSCDLCGHRGVLTRAEMDDLIAEGELTPEEAAAARPAADPGVE